MAEFTPFSPASELIVCPVCHASLRTEADAVVCTGCNRRYPLVDGIPVLLAERADD